jgi:hypothetical protein
MISKDEIIRMAVEAGIFPKWKPADSEIDAAERFASLVQANTQEQCAKVCELNSERWPDPRKVYAAHECAAAIRAMK